MKRVESFFEKTIPPERDLFDAEDMMAFAEAYLEFVNKEKKKEAAASDSFTLFWETYHRLSGMPKTDKDATLKYWNKLNVSERDLAIDKIPDYLKQVRERYGTLKYAKKARTYLDDKNFNDEFETTPQSDTESNKMTFNAGDINDLR